MEIINWPLIANPYNWATVLLMALFGLILLALMFPEPSTEQS